MPICMSHSLTEGLSVRSWGRIPHWQCRQRAGRDASSTLWAYAYQYYGKGLLTVGVQCRGVRANRHTTLKCYSAVRMYCVRTFSKQLTEKLAAVRMWLTRVMGTGSSTYTHAIYPNDKVCDYESKQKEITYVT